MGNSRAASVPARCHLCQKSFSRQEHLNRHLLSHTNEKPYPCTRCRKRFARADILSRHHAAHHSDNAVPATRRTIGAGFRACRSCAAARVKCSGADPCDRCSNRGIECKYPPPARKTAEIGDQQEIAQLPADDDVGFTFIGSHTMALSASNIGARGEVGPFEGSAYPATDTVANQPPNPSQQNAHISSPAYQHSSVRNGALSYCAQPEIQDSSSRSIVHQADSVDPYDFALQANNDFQETQFSGLNSTSINWLSPTGYGYDDFIFDDTSLEMFGARPMLLTSNSMANDDASVQSFREVNGDSGEGNRSFCDSNRSKSHVSERSHTSTTEYTGSPSGSASLSNMSFGTRPPARYVDGTGARDPRYGKLRRNHLLPRNCKAQVIDSIYQSTAGDVSFPSTLNTSATQYEQQDLSEISPRIYEKAFSEFNKHCIDTAKPFAAQYFPSIDMFYLGIRLYFEYFHDVYTLLHKSSILTCQDENAFIVFIAISSIGIKFLGTSNANKCSEAWLEFLLRLIEHVEFELNLPEMNIFSGRSSSQLTQVNYYVLQAQILGTLGMFNSCNEKLVQRAFDWRAKLVNRCLKLELLQNETKEFEGIDILGQSSWGTWILTETRRRVGYFIWLLDTIIAYQTDYRPQLLLIDAKASLPCHEDFWAIAEHSTLHEMETKFGECPSLLGALEALYKNKFVNNNLGELGRTILIHGLYRRTWEVASYHANTLSKWIPSAPGTRPNGRPGSEEPEDWPPGNPTFAKWRNSACDCLDILHWEANSKIAQRVGLEHPLILHLHLARVILLTPASTIQNLATGLIRNSTKTNILTSESLTPQLRKYRNEIVRWFLQDQYKSRLSLVHAGAIFWHARRYSHDSFLEPYAVFLSTLVFWAYVTSFQLVDQQKCQLPGNKAATGHQTNLQRIDVNSDDIVDRDVNYRTDDTLIDSPYINLDRPCDDELIQTFVRHGTRMTGYMTGVGNINQAGSAVKILGEGAKILLNSGTNFHSTETENNQSEVPLPTWRMATKYSIILEDLAELRNV